MAEETTKRNKILERKTALGDKVSDIMSFITNSENIWEYLGYDLQDILSLQQEHKLIDLLSSHHNNMELEKMKLKKDWQIIDKLIVINEDGQVTGRKDLLFMAIKKIYKQEDGGEDEDSSDD